VSQNAAPILSKADGKINLNVGTNVNSPSPIIITFAYKNSNYVFEERESIVAAWGGSGISTFNGPFPANTKCWLFWDIDPSTGAISRGWTVVPPVTSATAPLSPQPDLHWFDTSKTTMRVRVGSAWIEKNRVFAGTYNTSGAVLTVNPPGSQVGLTGKFRGGNVLLGTGNYPLRQNDGAFLTTADQLIVANTSGLNVRVEGIQEYGTAVQNLAAFSFVSVSSASTKYQKQFQLAKSTDVDVEDFAVGMVVDDLSVSEVGNLVTSGYVTNQDWFWDITKVNKPVFLSDMGTATDVPPTTGVLQRVGTIYDVHTILLRIDPPVRLLS